ncbi:hypothetical protein ApDm4_2490 [Acetobacter pomorum]|nr:hypothetical protein ApDm4_2490 [Acetobacter pomorum]
MAHRQKRKNNCGEHSNKRAAIPLYASPFKNLSQAYSLQVCNVGPKTPIAYQIACAFPEATFKNPWSHSGGFA